MLREDQSQLLTAYVDNELDERDRQGVEALLRQSAEARQLLSRLQADARALRQLPRRAPPQDLAAHVLQRIQEKRAAQPMRPVAIHWRRLAIAASLLLAAGVGTSLYWAFSGVQHVKDQELAQVSRPPSPALAEPSSREMDKQKNSAARAAEPAIVPSLSPPAAKPSAGPTQTVPGQLGPNGNGISQEQSQQRPTAARAPAQDELALDDSMKFEVSALTDQNARQRLSRQLEQTNPCRLEVVCNDSNRALEQVQILCKAVNVQLIIDPEAQQRLKQPAQQTDYLIYTEALTTGEVAETLQQLGETEEKAKRDGTGVLFRQVYVKPPNRDDYRRLDALGISLKTPPAHRGRLVLGDEEAPGEEMPQSERNLPIRQGGTSGPAGHSPMPTRYALVVPQYPKDRGLSLSTAKEFRAAQKWKRAGTRQLLLILHASAAGNSSP